MIAFRPPNASDVRALPPLAKSLSSSHDPDYREAVVNALGEFSDMPEVEPSVMESLSAALSDRDKRWDAARALCRIRSG